MFIVGAPRSGTSLLRNLMRACDDIYLPPDETQFIPAYLHLAARNSSTSSLLSFLDRSPFSVNMRKRGIWPSRDELREILADPAPAVAIPELMRCLADREGEPFFARWGDKSPTYVYSLDKLREVFAGMRVLFIFRDPRDVVLSMHEAWGRSLVRGAMTWRDVARIAQQYTRTYGHSTTMVTSYEALATNPSAVMGQVASWLGVGYSEEALDNYVGEEKWGAVRGAGVASSSVGRYRTGLSRAEVEFVERIVFDELGWYGYVPEFARESYAPTRMRLQCARVADGLRSLAPYVRERGLREGLSYKFRQFLVARRGRDG